MKKLLFFAAVLGFTATTTTVSAQDGQKEKEVKELKVKGEKLKEKKNSDEIIIRRVGDKNVNVIVEMKDGKVTINGKPIDEFKDDNVKVIRRKTSVLNGDDLLGNINMDMANGWNSFTPVPGMAWSDDGDGKEIKRAFLGVSTVNNDEGAKITAVTKESAAEKAGLKEGDIIYKIDDAKIEDQGDLSEFIGTKKTNDVLTVYYKRDGKDASAKATLGEHSEKGFRSFSFTPGTPKVFDNDHALAAPNMDFFKDGKEMDALKNLTVAGFGRPKIGLKIQDLEEGEGVKVLGADKDSPAEKAGLQKDDIITEINGTKVANTDDARESLKPAEGKTSYTVKAKRNGTVMTFEVKIPKKLKTANF